MSGGVGEEAVRLCVHPDGPRPRVPAGSRLRPAVFLDRDDTLTDTAGATAGTSHAGELFDPGRVVLLPGVAQALGRLESAGYALVVVTNQGAVARGRCTLEDVRAVNARINELLRAWHGGVIEAYYVCPYHPRRTPTNVEAYTREHPWRKPSSGMLLAAAEDLRLDLSRSWIVGDLPRDTEAGRGAGLAAHRCLRIPSPHERGGGGASALPDGLGRREGAGGAVTAGGSGDGGQALPEADAEDLAHAADLILSAGGCGLV